MFLHSLHLSAQVPHQVLAVAPGAAPEANAGSRLNALLPRTPLQADVSNAVQKKEEGASSSGGTRADASLQRSFNVILNSHINIILGC